jgi:hypothetical protein
MTLVLRSEQHNLTEKHGGKPLQDLAIHGRIYIKMNVKSVTMR